MKNQQIDDLFTLKIQEIYNIYLPSKHPFFAQLVEFPHEKLRSPDLLGNFHLRYQSACHATRVMIYKIPFLDSPSLRNRLVKIITDDDKLNLFDSHHYQLTQLFVNIGANILLDDEDFGELNKLKKLLDSKTAYFISLTQELYPKNLGAWCVIEIFADNWMRALMNSLSPCFPLVNQESYFSECFDQNIEEQHAQESIILTSKVLQESPELFESTIIDAYKMAEGLNVLWMSLEELLIENY